MACLFFTKTKLVFKLINCIFELMIKKTYDIKYAIERLKHYCVLQDKCHWDIKQKMQKWNLTQVSQDHILELLIKEKYIDEERYTRSFCRGKFKIKKWGKQKIVNELKKKHISDIYINKGLQEINETEYQKTLEYQYQKKHKSIKTRNRFIKKKKIATYLINKGYESNLVWDKLRELE